MRRLVRTATLAKKNSEYILAERSLGAGPIRILARHILPNIIGPLFILGSMDIPSGDHARSRPDLLSAWAFRRRRRAGAASCSEGYNRHPRCALDRRSPAASR